MHDHVSYAYGRQTGEIMTSLLYRRGVLGQGPIRSGKLVRWVLRTCSAVGRDANWVVQGCMRYAQPMHPISRRNFPSAVLLTTFVRAQPGQLIRHHSAPRLIRWDG